MKKLLTIFIMIAVIFVLCACTTDTADTTATTTISHTTTEDSSYIDVDLFPSDTPTEEESEQLSTVILEVPEYDPFAN